MTLPRLSFVSVTESPVLTVSLKAPPDGGAFPMGLCFSPSVSPPCPSLFSHQAKCETSQRCCNCSYLHPKPSPSWCVRQFYHLGSHSGCQTLGEASAIASACLRISLSVLSLRCISTKWGSLPRAVADGCAVRVPHRSRQGEGAERQPVPLPHWMLLGSCLLSGVPFSNLHKRWDTPEMALLIFSKHTLPFPASVSLLCLLASLDSLPLFPPHKFLFI